MQPSISRTRAYWLFAVSGLVFTLVILGGLVRLTRSGLSIVEWDVITGVIPPIGEAAWQEAFAKYQGSPEFQKINQNMTLDEYRFIYYMEYFHRLLGRVAGLAFVLPLFYFLARGQIRLRQSLPYLLIGIGFAFQGWLGWYMVASGLVDIPAVSHYRLTAHLLAALALLSLTFWVGLDNLRGPARLGTARSQPRIFGLLVAIGVTYLVQVSWGGFVAGLKAGFISNTWPLMGGRLVPPGMFQRFEPWFLNLVSEHMTVHFIHRWFAFVVLALVIWLLRVLQRQGAGRQWKAGAYWLLGLVLLQITLGISVVLFSVPISLASLHQTVGIGIFLALLYLGHNLMLPSPTGRKKQAKAFVKKPLPAS